MKRSTLVSASGAAIVALGVCNTIDAKAAQSAPTPEALINFSNSQIFDEGAVKYHFFNPRRCRLTAFNDYLCHVDYTKTTSLGTKTCTNARVLATPSFDDWGWGNNSGRECSDWEKVSMKTEVAENNNEAITPTHIGISAASLIVGACIGFFFGRKKD